MREGVKGGVCIGLISFHSLSLAKPLHLRLREGDSLSLSAVPRRNGDNPSLRGSASKRNRLFPWLVDEPTNLSLSSWLLEETIRLLKWLSSRRKSLTISLSVCLVDGKGLLSLLWIYWNRKVRYFFAVALVDGAFSR
ncbi:hypothetical protein F2Q69_00019121 [Brassica cretica]|uniref:Uncharacterized protein n=1 Tax=Brassica cretica TaxID=69181 RepID=A0A8S9QHS3_BRACR|nr:hypothetical protein F2Q69_00019121 [Brassica cretica]